MFTHSIETAITIHTPASRVWQVLTDFADFPEWNPFIRSARGSLQDGARLEILIQPSGTRGMAFSPRVLSVKTGCELRWLGQLGLPGIFDGEHIFWLEDIPGGFCRLRQNEHFRGILVPILRKGLERDTRRGFLEMNVALKARAERGMVADQSVTNDREPAPLL